MTDPATLEGDEMMKAGLLMEAVHAQQQLANTCLERLVTHSQGLDGVVRDEIRRTLIDQIQSLTAECEQAAAALRTVKRAANMRGVMWNVGATLLFVAIPVAIVLYTLPSAASIADLRAERSRLEQNIARLARLGGRVDWRSCGERLRLCVRIDRQSPAYGNSADYYVVKEY